jgi:hypothetical protein
MSKLNPQKASAYVGPGVLRKGGKITPVPNGPLIKKKGEFKGSTLKSGGKIKKAQTGDTIYTKKDKVDNVRTNKYVVRLPDGSIEMGKETKTKTPNGKTTVSKKSSKSSLLGMKYTDDEIRKSMEKKKNGGIMKKKAQQGVKIGNTTYNFTNVKDDPKKKVYVNNPIKDTTSAPKVTASDRMNKIINTANKTVKKRKAGGMIKRADGSYSKRGLWDNIRANKGSGKKPTKQMLQQEKKIKAKTKK